MTSVPAGVGPVVRLIPVAADRLTDSQSYQLNRGWDPGISMSTSRLSTSWHAAAGGGSGEAAARTGLRHAAEAHASSLGYKGAPCSSP